MDTTSGETRAEAEDEEEGKPDPRMRKKSSAMVLRFTSEQSVSLHTHRHENLADMDAMIPPAPMEATDPLQHTHGKLRGPTEGGIANDVKHRRSSAVVMRWNE